MCASGAGCRVAKVRCDRNYPCTRCVRLGTECITPKSVPRGRPSRARLAERARLAGLAAVHGTKQKHVEEEEEQEEEEEEGGDESDESDEAGAAAAEGGEEEETQPSVVA